ncbi:hypothetical protein C8Q80DRAFT_1186804 [Daedaleopsis nitida]|nr:hypothetical protein C8Q80DRAFT_1186804 [Daedaleopsis nitida]
MGPRCSSCALRHFAAPGNVWKQAGMRRNYSNANGNSSAPLTRRVSTTRFIKSTNSAILVDNIIEANPTTSSVILQRAHDIPHGRHQRSILASGRAYSTAPSNPPALGPDAHHIQPTISTLRTDRITEADFICFPTEQEYAFIWDAHATQTTATNVTKRTRPFASFRREEGTSFPAGLQGYLYYHMPYGPAPATAGEIRFRVMYSPSPLGFNNGRDLPIGDDRGLTWRIPLVVVASQDSYQVFRDILLRDGLVSQQTMRIAAKLGRERHKLPHGLPPLVYSFRQKFYMDFGRRLHSWHFLANDKLCLMPPITNILTWKTGPGQRTSSPWLGGGICAFFPDEHWQRQGRSVVNMKLLETIKSEPITRNPEFPESLWPLVVKPQAGKLLHAGQAVWRIALDQAATPVREAFQVLFDNSELPWLRTHRSLRPRAPGQREEEAAKAAKEYLARPMLRPRV